MTSSLLPHTLPLLLVVSFFVLCFQCFVGVQSVAAAPPDIIELTINQFHDYIVDGNHFDVIIDVRSIDEWNSGHIANTTLMVNFASYTPNSTSNTTEIASPKELDGCQYCTIAVYCRSGNRAGQALLILQEQGFMGQLYNGLGVSQWTDAGYELTTDPDVIVPACTTNTTVSDTCKMKATAPATSNTEPPTTTDNDAKDDSSSSLEILRSSIFPIIFALFVATMMAS